MRFDAVPTPTRDVYPGIEVTAILKRRTALDYSVLSHHRSVLIQAR